MGENFYLADFIAFWHYRCRRKGGNFLETMINLSKQGKTIKVIADQYISPTHTLDVARAVKSLIESNFGEYGIYHACNSGSCSWYEFAKAIFDMTDINADLSPTTCNAYTFKAKRPKYSGMDNSKLDRIYPLKPWRDALRDYIELKKKQDKIFPESALPADLE